MVFRSIATKLLLLLIASLLISPFSLSAGEEDALNRLLSTKGMEHAAIGISVKKVSGAGVVCQYNQQISLTPASVCKLFPTLLALEMYGAGTTYQTQLLCSGDISDGVLNGDLIILAGGDPTLLSSYFPKSDFFGRIINSLKSLGINRITGTVIVEEEWESPNIPGSWLWEDIANYYGALYHSFNYRDNYYTLTIESGRDGQPASITDIEPKLEGVEFDNRVITDIHNRNDVWIYGGPNASKLLVKGTVTGNPLRYKIKGAMHHPASLFISELICLLSSTGIVVEDRDILKREERLIIGTYTSPELREIVFYTNKRSVNMFAEALGYLVDPENFEERVKQELMDRGIDGDGVVLKDACGLSPFNAVPAEVFTDMLCNAYNYADIAFRNSLPMGGVDGGLAIYADHPLLGKRVRAKTGSITGVRALSGYLTTKEGEELAFTVMINNFTCTSQEVQRAVRDFLAALANLADK